MSESVSTPAGFRDFGLIEPVMKALKDVGYETPTPIQTETIPHVLSGRDLLGQAQTGTGKTAAFALPLLSRIDLKKMVPQVLVLTPTRELAIQVAEAFQHYAAHLHGFHVLPIYGGQDYGIQLRQLKRGAHVVVGTPGRVMDHMRRETLNLDKLTCLVLDEADEMLRMGFIDDVQWILEKTPPERQITLFSATLPEQIRRIAKKHLKSPIEITIKMRTTVVETIHQRYWMVSGTHKLDALTRILEGEVFDGMLIFVRTKTETIELAEKLESRGYACTPLNGDIPQKQRERTIEGLKSGKYDILVATDVAARGLDVDRISHVINYDIPHDTEAYIHRIGRTGRAGRSGEAILFVAPRERRMLLDIEKATRQKIETMVLPSTEFINDKRLAKFKDRITDTLAVEELGFFYQLAEQYQNEHNVPALQIAAALAKMVQGDKPLFLPLKTKFAEDEQDDSSRKKKTSSRRGSEGFDDGGDAPRRRKGKPASEPEEGMTRYRIEVGRVHNVKPGNIVGAIANEAGIDSKYIGRIDIFDDYSTVDLPDATSREVIQVLKRVWIAGQQLKISKLGETGKSRSAPRFDESRSPKSPRNKSGFPPRGKSKPEGYAKKNKSK